MLSKVLTGEMARRAELMFLPNATLPAGPLDAPPTQIDPSVHAAVEDRSAEVDTLREQLHALQETNVQREREAYTKGQQQGIAQAQAELDPIVTRLKASIVETATLRSELRRAAERDLVQLALAIARRVLHRELQVDESALNALARFAFERLSRSEKYRVTTHPRFAPSIRGSLPPHSGIHIEVEADPACLPGALLIHTEGGAVDASVDTQLEEINKGLTDRIA